MNPDDVIEGGLIRDTDLDGGPPGDEAAKPDAIGRYMLLEELGRGGAGVVYRALDTLLNREVALKRLRFGDFDLESRFLREAELLALLSHPGIMPIFDFGREGDSYFYTMPLASGLSLDRWVAERKPDAREAARLVRQAAEALAHAHERGVLHRDVKPANILVSDKGDTLLADFGLGRIEGAADSKEPRMTESGKIMGTPGYMAPEFISGDLKGVDARCDVYALGATLYEAITGQPPFVGKSSMEIMSRVIAEDPAPPRKLAPHTPGDLEIVCMKALERIPARRYATAREFADDLGRFIEGEPIRARRATLSFRVRRYVGRRRAIVTVAMAGLLVAAGIAGFAAWRAREDLHKRRRVTDHLELAARHAGAINDLLRTHAESDSEVAKQAALAFEEIDKAMEIEPENADAHFLRGRIHSLRFEKEEARRCYEMAIRKGPVARAHLERALLDCQDLVVLRAGGTPSARIEELKAGVRRDLKEFMARLSDPDELEFAKALVEFSRLEAPGPEEATRILQRYADHTRDWRAYYWKGVAEMEAGHFPSAKKSLETALDSRQRCRASAYILDRLGVACVFLDLHPEAESRFRSAVELDPGLLAPKVNLASLYLELDRPVEAAKWSEEALKVEPGMPLAHAIRGQAYVMQHQARAVREDADACRPLLRAAKESLQAAMTAFPADSEQGRELRKDWDYVQRELDY